MRLFSLLHCGRAFLPLVLLSLFPALAIAQPVRSAEALQTETPPAGMLRFPAISADYIAFGYATQLWIVPRMGGVAKPVAFPRGSALQPAFSPDGQWIAFLANYDGQRDIYAIPVHGGVPRRLTTHPGGKNIHTWTRCGTGVVYSTSAFSGSGRVLELYIAPLEPGMPQRMPVAYGVNASFSPDGESIAFMTHTRDFRTWKRYRGGMATDIWTLNLETSDSRRITDWEGTDTLPMWHGDHIYYLSDENTPYRLNVWRYNVNTHERAQITFFTEHDLRFPSLGPGPDGAGEIVFQHGQQLKVLELENYTVRVVEVRIPGALPILRQQTVDASRHITQRGISPTGARVLLEARGDIWSLPARHGSARNLTRTSGIAERQPAWSPDGQWILFSSDRSGEYQLTLMRADGSGEQIQLTFEPGNYYYTPLWAPDSKRFAVHDKAQRIWTGVIPAEGEEPQPLVFVDHEPAWPVLSADWSPDSKWLVYSLGESTEQHRLPTRALWAFSVESGERTRLTSGMFTAWAPTFDRTGDFLYFVANSEFNDPQYEDVGTTFVYINTGRIMAVPLRTDLKVPFHPRSDEEKGASRAATRPSANGNNDNNNGNDDVPEPSDPSEEPGDAGELAADTGEAETSQEEPVSEEQTEKAEEEKPAMKFVWERFEQRAIPTPAERGNFGNLFVNDRGHLLYHRLRTNRWGGGGDLVLLDLTAANPSETTILENVNSVSMSADGKKLLAVRGNAMSVINAAPNQRWEHAVNTGTMQQRLDPRAEWAQMLRDVWRRQRDFFYVENLHGVDWDAIWEQYSALLPYISSRGDLLFVMGEMIAELNVGHAYISGGDFEDEPSLNVGLLGADFSWDAVSQAYRIDRIFRGAPWDFDARGPLAQPGLQVTEGNFLISINQLEISRQVDPWQAAVGLANQVVTVEVAEDPSDPETFRTLVTRLVASESDLRFRAWVEDNRARVYRESGGRIGYIFVPNTGVDGQNELFRQFFGQIGREALIIDERWNGGGQLPHRFVELLNRPVQMYWARRDGKDWATPADGHNGPKAMLINGLAGSGGDAFPYLFRRAGLGKLIGTRTWGGLVGITPVPGLIDGGSTAVPTFGVYSTAGHWMIEGHGVDPDIEVWDDPGLMTAGGDPQLEAAIQHLLEELDRNPVVHPPQPAAPDRGGFGIDPAHR